jgi:hypothetical protein
MSIYFFKYVVKDPGRYPLSPHTEMPLPGLQA